MSTIYHRFPGDLTVTGGTERGPHRKLRYVPGVGLGRIPALWGRREMPGGHNGVGVRACVSVRGITLAGESLSAGHSARVSVSLLLNRSWLHRLPPLSCGVSGNARLAEISKFPRIHRLSRGGGGRVHPPVPAFDAHVRDDFLKQKNHRCEQVKENGA